MISLWVNTEPSWELPTCWCNKGSEPESAPQQRKCNSLSTPANKKKVQDEVELVIV